MAKKDGVYKISGRPKFLTEAKAIKLKEGQDRRHVLGWDDFIKPNLEKAINSLVAKNENNETYAKTKLIELSKQYHLQRGPKAESASLEEHMKFVATQLNSSSSNLNPEASHENQAIDVVRRQAISLKKSFYETFKEDVPEVLINKNDDAW